MTTRYQTGDVYYDAFVQDLAAQRGVSIDLAVSAAERKAAKGKGATLPGTMAFPTTNRAQFQKAVKMVGLSKYPAVKIKAYLKARAKAMGWESDLPKDWQ